MKILTTLFILFISCQSTILSNVNEIKIYAISPYSTSLVPVGDDWVKYEDATRIKEKDEIDFIVSRMKNLDKAVMKKFDSSNLRLKCILYNERRDSSILEYNNYAIRLNDVVYSSDSTLIEYLYSKVLF